MKTLLILRHAKSSWKDMSLTDHDRPLKKRGQRDAPRMGRLLHKQGLVPDLILSSTAKRAITTAVMLADACGYENDIDVRREFYPGYPDAYIDALREAADEYQTVMVVGHNPGLEELLDLLTEAGESLPTAALAQVALPIRSWDQLNFEISGELVNLWRPREVQD
jgi:phosphohistidine phosphatase